MYEGILSLSALIFASAVLCWTVYVDRKPKQKIEDKIDYEAL